MSVLPPFELVRPPDLGGALEALSADHLPYAGGTELLLAMRQGLLRPAALVDLKGVRELSGISVIDGSIVIGGAVTHRTASHAGEVRASLPALAEVLQRVGSPRVRSVGTLGGNLCFAEPKSDVATILIALGAEVELASTDGARVMPVADLLAGPYTTVREENELLTSISVPVVDDRKVVYEKFQTMERPTVAVAGVAEPDGSRRVVVGAVGGRPETFAIGPDGHDPEEIEESLEIFPDLTGTESYKRHIVSLLLARVMRRLGWTT